jgi:hypothetical protein
MSLVPAVSASVTAGTKVVRGPPAALTFPTVELS